MVKPDQHQAEVAEAKVPQERRAVEAEAYLTPTVAPVGLALTVTASPRRCGPMRAAVAGEATLLPITQRAVLAAVVKAGVPRRPTCREIALSPIRVAVVGVPTPANRPLSRMAVLALRVSSSSDTRWADG